MRPQQNIFLPNDLTKGLPPGGLPSRTAHSSFSMGLSQGAAARSTVLSRRLCGAQGRGGSTSCGAPARPPSGQREGRGFAGSLRTSHLTSIPPVTPRLSCRLASFEGCCSAPREGCFSAAALCVWVKRTLDGQGRTGARGCARLWGGGGRSSRAPGQLGAALRGLLRRGRRGAGLQASAAGFLLAL